MPQLRKRYSRAELDQAVREAEQRGEQRGSEKTLRDLERVIAGEEPEILTLDTVKGWTPEQVNARWPEVRELMEGSG